MQCAAMFICNEMFVWPMCGVTICFGGCKFFIPFSLNITNRVNVMTTSEVINPISLEDIPLF